jgi:hypothetical protein
MYAALASGTWVGASHDGTLLPLASISATVGIILFVGTRLLARHGKSISGNRRIASADFLIQ